MPGTKRPHQVGVLLSPIRLWDGAGVVDRTALRIGPCAQILIRCFFMAALEFHEMPVSCERWVTLAGLYVPVAPLLSPSHLVGESVCPGVA